MVTTLRPQVPIRSLSFSFPSSLSNVRTEPSYPLSIFDKFSQSSTVIHSHAAAGRAPSSAEYNRQSSASGKFNLQNRRSSHQSLLKLHSDVNTTPSTQVFFLIGQKPSRNVEARGWNGSTYQVVPDLIRQ